MIKAVPLIPLLFILMSWQQADKFTELTTLEKLGYFEDIVRATEHKYLVKHLNLKYQDLTEIPTEVYSMSNLEILDVAQNQITVLSDRLVELPKLKKLYLNSNLISTLPANFKDLKIQLLYIQNNPINNLIDLSVVLPETVTELEAGNPESDINETQPQLKSVEPEKVKR